MEVAGYFSALAHGFHELRIEVDYVQFEPHRFNYDYPRSKFWMLRLLAWLNSFSHNRGLVSGLPFRMLAVIVRLAFVTVSFWRYDTFIFGSGVSLLPKNLDLPILRFLQKKVVMILGFGSDARPPYINGPTNYSLSKDLLQLFRKRAITRKRKLRFAFNYAAIVIGAPYSTSQFAERPFVNWFAIGFPRKVDAPANNQQGITSDVQDNLESSRPVRILHSPSHPEVKGTQKIREAIKNLINKGIAIDYIEIVGRPNHEVLDELKKCDFVVDQVYSDTPLAGLATEAAFYGKPTVVGGYGLEKLKDLVAAEMWPPSHICHPNSIQDAIQQFAQDAKLRQTTGQKAQEFVTTQWSATCVAKRYLQLLRNQVPVEWMLDPRDVSYLHGCGLDETQSRQNIRDMLERFGPTSLQLTHRPALQQAFIEFSAGSLETSC